MKIFKKSKRIVVDLEIDTITCNKCGYSRKNEYKSIEHREFYYSNYTWGFGSLKDTDTYSFELCERCYDEVVKSFKISPEIRGLI